MLPVAGSQTIEFDLPKSRKILSLNDLLFTPGRAIWVMLEGFLTFGLFLFSVLQSPHYESGSLDSAMVGLALWFAFVHSIMSLGLGQYERFRRFSFSKIITNGMLAAIIAFVASITMTYLQFYDVFGRLTVIWGTIGSMLGVLVFRMIFASLFSFFPYRFAILGSSKISQEIVDFLTNPQTRESRFFVYIPIDRNLSVEQIWNLAHSKGIYDFIVCADFKKDPNFHEILLGTQERRIRLIDETQFYSDLFECIPLEQVTPDLIIGSRIDARSINKDLLKRSFDFIVAFLALVILSPLMLTIAAIIKATSKGDVLFIQPRQGRFGRSFKMYKFRTMHQELSCKEATGGFTQANDARITRMGQLLRPLHLDELPQLWNILKGDMSLVGPRPEALSFARKMSAVIPIYDLRYIVRPGLTGHAQLLAGYMMDTLDDTRKKLSYDLYYIMNHSLRLDLRIVLRTFFVVLKKIWK